MPIIMDQELSRSCAEPKSGDEIRLHEPAEFSPRAKSFLKLVDGYQQAHSITDVQRVPEDVLNQLWRTSSGNNGD